MRHVACLFLTASALALSSCGGGSATTGSVAVGDLITDPVHLDSDGVDSAVVNLNMGVGDLDVSGGATAGLVDGKLEYNVPSWKPKVQQSKEGRSAHLTIEQPSSSGKSSVEHTQNHWTLHTSDTIPLTFEIQCGVGKADLNLGSTKLRQVSLNVGVGEIHLDLRGHPDQDYNVKVQGGVGEVTIYLPADASVRANVQNGLAPVKVEGLEKHGDTWESPDYGKVKPAIQLEVNGGIGQIHIIK